MSTLKRLSPAALRRLHVHRYAGLVRPLAGDERDRLRDSLSDGYDPLHPIVVTPGGEIVDGRNRRDLCVELELPAVVVERTFASDAELARFVVAMNLARRHLDQRERRELAGRLVVNGTSTRQAAKAAGVSQSTAGRAATEARAQVSHADSPTPTRTLGIDGKRYPATRLGPGEKPRAPGALKEILDPIDKYLRGWDDHRLTGASPAEARRLLAKVQRINRTLTEVAIDLEKRTIVPRALR
jgi:hypothetical protein